MDRVHEGRAREGPAPLRTRRAAAWPRSRARSSGMAASGLRTLAVAERRFESRPENLELAEEQLTFLGVRRLVDPPRPEVPEAIRDRAARRSARDHGDRRP